MNHFPMGLWRVAKVNSVQQPAATNSVDGPRRSSKALPKARLAPNKGQAHSLVVCCLSDPLQLSECPRNHYIWDVSSVNWWNAPKIARPAAALISRKGPILHTTTKPHIAQPTFQKLNELDYKILLHLPYSPDLLPTDHHFFKHLNVLQAKCFHNQQDTENAFQEFIESHSMNF